MGATAPERQPMSLTYRLAARMAHARPHWFEHEKEGTPWRQIERDRLAWTLTSRTSAADLGAARSAHRADIDRTAALARLLASDWLPAHAIEYLDN